MFFIEIIINKTMLFAIDGNIGSGKSSRVNDLKKYLKLNPSFIFLQEPVDDWNSIKSKDGTTILEKFYCDQDKYAFSFQMMAYISRLALLRKTIRENPDCHIVTERSIFTDRNVFAKMLYDDSKIEEVNYQIYLKWFDEFAQETKLDGIIYVHTDPTVCYNRIKKRSRTGEESIPLDYLEKCHKYHNDWILNGENNIHIIDGNVDTDESPDIIRTWMEDIVNYMGDIIDNEESPKFKDEKLYFNYNHIHNIIESMVPRIREFNPDVIIAIGGGGFIPARMLRTHVKVPILAVSVELYDDTTNSAGTNVNIKQWFDDSYGTGKLVKNGRVLIIDEIDDTRKTLECVVNKVQQHNPSDIAVGVIHNKIKKKSGVLPQSIKYISGKDIDDDWVIYPWDDKN